MSPSDPPTPSSPAHVVIHPVRLRILQALSRAPQTTRALARLLHDVPQSSLYRHIKVLVDEGFIQAETLPTPPGTTRRGAPERRYTLTRSAHLAQSDIDDLSPDDHRRMFTVYLMTLLREFGLYLGDDTRTPNFTADRTGYTEVTFYASEAEFDAAIQAMNAALGPLLSQQPSPDRRLRKLATVTFPLQDPASEDA